jgi:hypothetical protein
VVGDEATYLKALSKEDQEANKEEMLAREKDLIFVSPLLIGFALKNKLWCMSSLISKRRYMISC